MRIFRITTLVALAMLLTATAFGDSIHDPKIIIRGVGGSIPDGCPDCRGVGMQFSFTSPAKGAGRLFFTNVSGKNWTSLKLIENGVPAEAINCVQSLFLSCRVSTLKNGSVEILLSGVKHKADNPRVGILNGSNFVMNFMCQGHGNCWPKGGINFTARAFAAPEPTTIALMATGVAGIFSRRKRWKNRLT